MRKILPVLPMAVLSPAKADTLINCDRLLDGESESLQINKTIQVKEKRIVAIHDRSAQSKDEHEDISLMQHVPFAMKDGHVFKQP